MTACCHFQNIHKPTSLQKSLKIQLEWFSSFVFLIQPRNFHEELKQYTSYCQDNRLQLPIKIFTGPWWLSPIFWDSPWTDHKQLQNHVTVASGAIWTAPAQGVGISKEQSALAEGWTAWHLPTLPFQRLCNLLNNQWLKQLVSECENYWVLMYT